MEYCISSERTGRTAERVDMIPIPTPELLFGVASANIDAMVARQPWSFYAYFFYAEQNRSRAAWFSGRNGHWSAVVTWDVTTAEQSVARWGDLFMRFG